MEGTANYVLLLTREVLERPAVLTEICAAHVANKATLGRLSMSTEVSVVDE